MKAALPLACLALLAPAPARAQDPPPAAPPTPPLEVKRGEVPPERPKFFALYPAPTPGTFTPSRPTPSTATRRPDLFAPYPVYPGRKNVLADAILDVRYKSERRSSQGIYLAAGRVTADYILADAKTGRERGGARFQLLAEPDALGETAIRQLRASELYGFYVFQIAHAEANAKLGQFVIPFGLAAVYDTPLQPIQTLYGPSLGLRVDTGAMLDGYAGVYHYAASFTTGSGPNRRDLAAGEVLAVRLERNFLTQSGRIQIGGSILTGKLPVTAYNTELPASGTSDSRMFVAKTRFAADASYYLQKLTTRGEVHFGADDQSQVYGFFGEGRYAFSAGKTAIATVRQWNFGAKPQEIATYGGGINFELKSGLTLRTLFEYERARPSASQPAQITRRFTVQTRVRF